jgi:tyrosyl-tRNA synthetase
MCAKLLQQRGLKPIILVGGATARMGDPSGKTTERALLSEEEINNNTRCIKEQLSKIIDFNSGKSNQAIMVDNNDWISKMSFIEFEREIGKLITVNYMMAKESVRSRFEREGCGISHLEMSYMLVQAYDFVHLYDKYNCKIQIAGKDQIGNCSVGLEYGRKRSGINDMCGWFIPLICDKNGNKFGKSENGKAIFLDGRITTPYEFFQFWLNQSDDDAKRFIKMFTLLPKEEIESLIEEHDKAPHLRLLQKRLAKEVTIMVHSEADYESAIKASSILFGDATNEVLRTIDETTLLSALSGVPTFSTTKDNFDNVKLTDLLVEKTNIFKSKGELRKLITNGGLSINKNKVISDCIIYKECLLNGKYLLVQQGKKKYSLIIAE